MKTDKRNGSIMLAAMIIIMLAAAMLAAYMKYSTGEAVITRRSIDHQKARIAAEAALEYGAIELRNIILKNQLRLSMSELQAELDAIPDPPSIPGYVYRTPGGDNAFEILIDDDVQLDTVITNGAQCRGMIGDCQTFTIRAGAINPQSGVGAVLRMNLQAVGVFLIRYAIFYEDDCEIQPGPNMTISGPVHCNSDLWLGAGATLTFQDRVTSVGNIFNHRKDEDKVSNGHVKINDESGYPEKMKRGDHILDSNYPSWISEALDVWDARVLSGDHGMQPLSPPIAPVDEPHDLIERPLDPDDPDYQQQTEEEKFANKACLYIYVDADGNTWVTNYYGNAVTNLIQVQLQQNGSHNGKPIYKKKSDKRYKILNNGCIDTTQQYFYDAREKKYMAPVDLYIDKLAPIIEDMGFDHHSGKGLVYVTRERPAGDTNRVPCVRLRNGKRIDLDVGLSVASDLPVYIEGNYNNVNTKPAMAAGDAVTMLSVKWRDAYSHDSLSSRIPANTYNHCVIMTGNTETYLWAHPKHYNGGVENVLRFLERWSGKTYYYRGSIIDLWYSQIADSNWSYGQYYTAPNRNWGYDEIYRTANPPGMTRVFGLEELNWIESSWELEDWN